MAMKSPLRRGHLYTPDESMKWLRQRMAELDISGLEELHAQCGIDKGSISRYFRQERVPGIDVIAPLCEALQVSPETLLVALGAIERKSRS